MIAKGEIQKLYIYVRKYRKSTIRMNKKTYCSIYMDTFECCQVYIWKDKTFLFCFFLSRCVVYKPKKIIWGVLFELLGPRVRSDPVSFPADSIISFSGSSDGRLKCIPIGILFDFPTYYTSIYKYIYIIYLYNSSRTTRLESKMVYTARLSLIKMKLSSPTLNGVALS